MPSNLALDLTPKPVLLPRVPFIQCALLIPPSPKACLTPPILFIWVMKNVSDVKLKRRGFIVFAKAGNTTRIHLSTASPGCRTHRYVCNTWGEGWGEAPTWFSNPTTFFLRQAITSVAALKLAVYPGWCQIHGSPLASAFAIAEVLSMNPHNLLPTYHPYLEPYQFWQLCSLSLGLIFFLLV